jgi:hypothetical protein
MSKPRVPFHILQQKLSNALALTPQFKKFTHIASNQGYIVQGVVLDVKTLEPFVIYRPLHVQNVSWAREQKDFLEKFK